MNVVKYEIEEVASLLCNPRLDFNNGYLSPRFNLIHC